jgi:hypothetical protein
MTLMLYMVSFFVPFICLDSVSELEGTNAHLREGWNDGKSVRKRGRGKMLNFNPKLNIEPNMP